MTVKTNIAEGLKKLRKQSGLSADEVGASIGKSGKTIYAWENERGQPDGDELITLCRLFNAHLRDFYGVEYDDCISESSQLSDLTQDEQSLIEMYRSTVDVGKSSIRKLAREFSEIMPLGSIEFYFPEELRKIPKHETTIEDLEWLRRRAQREYEESD